MSSKRQVAANRRNAKKSTGPKTPEGKEVVSSNALWHGYRAETLVLPGENGEEYKELAEQLYDDYEPAPGFECILVGRIARLLWRLRRAPKVELGIFGTAQARVGQKLLVETDSFLGGYRTFIESLGEGATEEEVFDAEGDGKPGGSTAILAREAMEQREQFQREHFGKAVLAESQADLATLSEYESQTEKQLERTVKMLEREQSHRRARDGEKAYRKEREEAVAALKLVPSKPAEPDNQVA